MKKKHIITLHMILCFSIYSTFGVIYANSNIKTSDFDLDIYAITNDVQSNTYFGAKYEPKAGIYFGNTVRDFDNELSQKISKKVTGYLLYLPWGQDITDFKYEFKLAKDRNVAIELAWTIDTAQEGAIENVKNQKSYIESTAQYLKSTDVPVFLRFANEMNIDEKLMNYPKEYIEAFRIVSTTVKSIAPNVAMLWSPNDISAKGHSYNEYYPGDEYVDWVGISSYHFPYFQGKKDWGKLQDKIDRLYFTGGNVNPVAKIKQFVQEYGNRKPIMLSETGVGNYAKTTEEDLTNWAQIQLQREYNYIPMVYPQVKAIFYFDNNLSFEKYNYSVSQNSTLLKLYNQLIQNPYFISNISQSAEVCYQKISNPITLPTNLKLMTYAIPPKVLEPTVVYSIDEKVIQTSRTVPYELNLDTNNISQGMHILKVEVLNDKTLLKSKTYNMHISKGGVQLADHPFEPQQLVQLIMDGKQIQFDQPAIIINGRTLVPLRVIFEKLGIQVSWNDKIKTASAQKGNTTISVQIGNKTAFVNDKKINLDVPAQILRNRTLVPVRFIAESLGCEVKWDDTNKSVSITTK